MNGLIEEIYLAIAFETSWAYNKIIWISIFSYSEGTGAHILFDIHSDHLNTKCVISLESLSILSWNIVKLSKKMSVVIWYMIFSNTSHNIWPQLFLIPFLFFLFLSFFSYFWEEGSMGWAFVIVLCKKFPFMKIILSHFLLIPIMNASDTALFF